MEFLLMLSPVWPEIWLLSMTCVMLLTDLYLPPQRRAPVAYGLAQLTLIGAFFLTVRLVGTDAAHLFYGHFVSDPLALGLKLALYVATALTLIYTRDYLTARGLLTGEYVTLLCIALLGMMVLVSGGSLLTVYLGLELLSLSLYSLVAMQRDTLQAAEAAVKYFILGAIASGMLLYGMSFLYGLTGSLELGVIAARLAQPGVPEAVAVIALVFILAGVGFKFALVPFHMWVPDVYQGASSAATLFIASVPKFAAFALVLRLLVETMPSLHSHWQPMLLLLAVLSIALGNLVAIVQQNFKRMLGYSAISHVGFLLLGIAAVSPAGYASALFYTYIYVLTTLAVFGVILLLSRAGFEAERLDDLKGLAQRQPWYALMLLILMFSLAGVPPMAGFHAKLSVLAAIIAQGYWWVAVLAVLFSVAGLYYALRVIWLMYFEAPTEQTPVNAAWDMQLALSANALLILGLGLYPAGLMAYCINLLT